MMIMYCDNCDSDTYFIMGKCPLCTPKTDSIWRKNVNEPCGRCGNKYIDFSGGCAACFFEDIANSFGDFGMSLQALTDSISSVFADVDLASIPTEKELARQRSRDDLKAKQRSTRRGGSAYRRQ